MKMRAEQVHLVIPAYNEGRRLPDYLPRLCGALADISLPLRITVVDDGSREDDSHKMQECVRLCGSRVRFHRIPANSGKGGAVYAGWELGPTQSGSDFWTQTGQSPRTRWSDCCAIWKGSMHRTHFLLPL